MNDWQTSKTLKDIAEAYAAIYEAKKVDQDKDGDNDFADVRIARMIASGVPKAKAIAMTKNKSYNKEEAELEEGIGKFLFSDKAHPKTVERARRKRQEERAAKKVIVKKDDLYNWSEKDLTPSERKGYHKVRESVEIKVDAKDHKLGEDTSLDEATAMAKRGYDETAIRNKIAKSTGGGESADRATALENRPTYGDSAKKKARQNLARKQRGDFRSTTSSSPGLHGYAHKSDDPAVKAKQAARGAQRGALTPREKKQLNREAYEAYELIASYLLENNFASTVENANVIINNMSESWFNQIIEG